MIKTRSNIQCITFYYTILGLNFLHCDVKRQIRNCFSLPYNVKSSCDGGFSQLVFEDIHRIQACIKCGPQTGVVLLPSNFCSRSFLCPWFFGKMYFKHFCMWTITVLLIFTELSLYKQYNCSQMFLVHGFCPTVPSHK